MDIERRDFPPDGGRPVGLYLCRDLHTEREYLQCAHCSGYGFAFDRLEYAYLRSGGTPGLVRVWKMRGVLKRGTRFILDHGTCIAIWQERK